MRSYFLLNRTQSARAWGRRGWLLMLKATQHRWGMQEDEEEEDADMEAEIVVNPGEGAIALRAGINLAMQEEDDDDMDYLGENFGKEDFGGLVRQLVELGEEGCFRLVVSFL